MKIKRFFAPDIRQAIRLVREEQGPDAVILSNSRVNGGIEIVAAVDYDETVFKAVKAEITGARPAEAAPAPAPAARYPSQSCAPFVSTVQYCFRN